MKSRADLRKAAEPASDFHKAGARSRDAAQYLEKRGFAGAVRPDYRHHLAGLYVEADVPKCPMQIRIALICRIMRVRREPMIHALKRRAGHRHDRFAQRPPTALLALGEPVVFGQPVD